MEGQAELGATGAGDRRDSGHLPLSLYVGAFLRFWSPAPLPVYICGLSCCQMMASLVLMVVRRMVAGTCPFMGLYLDMEQGTVTPTYVTPEAVKRVMKASRRGRRRTV